MPNTFRKIKNYANKEGSILALKKDGISATKQELQKVRENDTMTLCELGNKYYEMYQYKKAFAWFYKAALQEHAESQAQVGVMYQKEEGVSQNFNRAMDLSLNVASTGNAKGQYAVGFLYHHGRGVSQDYEKAMEWYLKAANNGNADAMNQIGRMYQLGKVVTKNIPIAIGWYTKAANQGNSNGQYFLGHIYQYEDGFKDLQKALNWHQKAANNGHWDSTKIINQFKKPRYYAKDKKQKASTQSENKTIKRNDINNNQSQPSTTIINNDNSTENLDEMFQSKINIIEGNSDALQKELTVLKQEKPQQYEKIKEQREKLARMEAGIQDEAHNDLNYDSSDNEDDNNNDINYDSECNKDEEGDGASKKELTAVKQEKLQQHEEIKQLNDKLAKLIVRREEDASFDLNYDSSDNEKDNENDINYDTECSNNEEEEEEEEENSAQQNNIHNKSIETYADPNHDSSNDKDLRNDIYLD